MIQSKAIAVDKKFTIFLHFKDILPNLDCCVGNVGIGHAGVVNFSSANMNSDVMLDGTHKDQVTFSMVAEEATIESLEVRVCNGRRWNWRVVYEFDEHDDSAQIIKIASYCFM